MERVNESERERDRVRIHTVRERERRVARRADAQIVNEWMTLCNKNMQVSRRAMSTAVLSNVPPNDYSRIHGNGITCRTPSCPLFVHACVSNIWSEPMLSVPSIDQNWSKPRCPSCTIPYSCCIDLNYDDDGRHRRHGRRSRFRTMVPRPHFLLRHGTNTPIRCSVISLGPTIANPSNLSIHLFVSCTMLSTTTQSPFLCAHNGIRSQCIQ